MARRMGCTRLGGTSATGVVVAVDEADDDGHVLAAVGGRVEAALHRLLLRGERRAGRLLEVCDGLLGARQVGLGLPGRNRLRLPAGSRPRDQEDADPEASL